MSTPSDPLLKKPRTDYYANAGFFSKLTFWYIFPLLRRKAITVDDVQPNLDEHDAKFLGDQLAEAYEGSKGSQNPLLSALRKVFGNRFYALGLLAFFKECIINTGKSILLGLFIRSFKHNKEIVLNRYLYGGILLLFMYIQCLSNNQYMFDSMHLALKMRIAVSDLIYRKCLKVSQRAIGRTGLGKITNFLSSDVGVFFQACQYAHFIWIAPVATLLSAIVVWRYVGVAAIAGILISILFIPFQFYISKLFGFLRSRIAASTDARLRLVNEILNGLLIIKMSTWEVPFTEIVEKARAVEMNLIMLRLMRATLVSTILQVSPRIALFATLVIFVYQGNQLDPETAFVTLALFTNLGSLMGKRAPMAILNLAEGLVSTRRISEFLEAEEYEGQRSIEGGDPSLRMDSVSTKWNEEGEECLQDLNLQLFPGKCICVLGPVGAGKTTLLLTILGETKITSGSMKVEGRIAYAAQNPCLFSGNVRENILFGHPWRPEWYDQVVDACALTRDFELLPFGDKTLVADKGVTLSGGQRARISLARAVYADADIYLLDDPLTSVDASVGRHLSEHVIQGLLSSKCVILATHLTQHSKLASEVILLDKGTSVARGTYEELSERDLIPTTPMDKVDDVTEDDGTEERNVVLADNLEPESNLEQSAKGTVGFGVAWQYLRVGNSLTFVTMVMGLYILSQSATTYSDIFIKTWTQGAEKLMTSGGPVSNSIYYVEVYSILLVPVIVFPLLTSVVHFWMCRRSSVKFHRHLFQAMIQAPMSFFERNPMGRILNRFSKDMSTTDINIPGTLNRVINRFLGTMAVFVKVCLNMAILLLPSLGITLIILFTRNFYLRTGTVVARLVATNKSPVFSHMSTTLYSLSTIRAYKAQAQFETQFNAFQNIHSSVDFTRILVRRWFASVVQFLTFAYFAIVTLCFMFIPSDPAAVGLAMSAALTVSNRIGPGINVSAELENRLVSVERIFQYMKVKPESRGGVKSLRGWPFNGGIQFQGARVSYIPGKDVLHGITCTFHPGEKVGIVGRTGAGKSTLVAAILRFVDLNSGMIHIDGIDISKVDRQYLRSKIAIIPQEPILFAGTLRKNLDPPGEHDDIELQEAVADSNLRERMSERGLETEVAENGTNFSYGERQLISIARALLKKTKILILDEATAHVDASMDSQIQKLVKEKFRNCTVLTIAHRLETILDSDRVCVMEAGSIIEFDSPATLLNNSQSRLSEFMKKSQTGASKDVPQS